VSTDITERKRAEEALKESEERFRSLVENSADGIAIIRADGTLANIGPSNERVLGYEMDRAPGLVTMFDRVHPADHPKLARRFELLLRDSKSVNSAEFRIQRKDGTWQTIEVTGKNLLDNPVIQGIVVNFRDITERKRAEEALKESEEKYRQLFESVSDVVYSLDTEFRFLSVSPSVQQALGYAPEELIGKSFTDMNLLPIEDLKLAAQDAVSILAGEEVTRTYGFIAKDGSTRIGEIKGAPLIREGRISGVIAVARDITERVRAEEKEREAERLREMDRMRTDLLANVSHELRTPLTTIKGYATMLSEFPEELAIEERKGYLETIELSADRLNELVESLLDMSRIDAGMLRIDRRPSDISRLLRQAAAEAQVRSPVHIIVTNLARDLPVVSFDPKRIRQVVDNIIDNAIKYSAQGTTIRVEGTLSGANILISVADQGMGIPANELDRVFERMYRLRRDAEAQVSGVGLGLSICRGVVDAHGGKIWAESVEGRGTTCFFTLPLVTDESILDQHRGG